MRNSGAFGVASLVLSAHHVFAGAFLYPEGEGQIIVSTSFADARKAYDARGRLVDTRAYDKLETRAYLEYGLTDWLTVVGEGGGMRFRGEGSPFDHLNQLTAEAQLGLPLSVSLTHGPHFLGPGAGAIGGRLHAFDYGSAVISVEASLRGSTHAARAFLDMRDDFQGDLRALLGRPTEFFGFSGFVDAQFGYRFRGQNGDEIRVDFTYGLRPLQSLTVLAQSYTSASVGQRTAARFVTSQKFQFSLVYALTTSVSLQVGAIHALGGLNTPMERGLMSALWCRF
jgi:protein XagA